MVTPGTVRARQGGSGTGGEHETAPGRFWRSGISPGVREPWGALGDYVMPGRNLCCADDASEECSVRSMPVSGR